MTVLGQDNTAAFDVIRSSAWVLWLVNQVLSKIIDGKPFARQAWFEESPSPAELTRIDSLVTEIRAAAPEDRDLLFQRHWPRWHLHGTHDEKLAQAGVQRERGERRVEERRGERREEERREESRASGLSSWKSGQKCHLSGWRAAECRLKRWHFSG